MLYFFLFTFRMSPKVLANWDTNKGELIHTTFSIMTTWWKREKRQELFDVIANATFPPGEEDKQWKASNKTKDTRHNKEFHQISIKV